MDEERDKLVRRLHARRRRMMARELKDYLAAPQVAKVLQFCRCGDKS